MTSENKFADNISPMATVVAESRSAAVMLLHELEEHQAGDDDAVIALHFTKASLYKLVTILMQLAWAASKTKPS